MRDHAGVPRRRPALIAPLLLAAACAAGVAAVYAVAVRTEAGQRADDAVRGGLSRGEAPAVYDATSDLLATISVSSLALLGLAIMALALLRGRPGLALAAGALVIGANVTTQLLKRELPRPDLLGAGGPGGSYPSGHVTVAVSLAAALVLVAPPAARWGAVALGTAYAGGVGIAVIALDWHRPSDVLGAQLVAVGWAGLAAAALAAGPRRRRGPARAPSRGAIVATGALVAAFAAIVALEASRRVDLLRLVDDRTAFTAAAALTAVACAALLAGLAAVVQRIRAVT